MAWIDAGPPRRRGRRARADRVPGLTRDRRRSTDFEWVADDDVARRRRHDHGRGRPLRARHRVPPRAHVLPEGRARAAGVGRPASPWSTRWPSTSQPLAEVLDGPGLAVMHAAGQDLEVLELACGTVPPTLFDTQLAAGFVGYATPSLAALAEQRARASACPRATGSPTGCAARSTPTSCAYAAADVAHLLALHDQLTADLESRGRLEWALDECEAAAHRAAARCATPSDAWRRIKEARHLAGHGRRRRPGGGRLARAAGRRDRPAGALRAARPRRGRHRPAGARRRVDELRAIRGLDDRHVAGRARRRAARRRSPTAASTRPVRPRSDAVVELERQLRPAVTLVSAWVSQLARDARASTRRCWPPGPTSRPLLGGDRGRPARRRLAGRAGRRADPPPGRGRRRPRLRRQGRPRPRGALPQAASSERSIRAAGLEAAATTAWSGASVPANGVALAGPSLPTSTVQPTAPASATGSSVKFTRHEPAVARRRPLPGQHAVGRVEARLVAELQRRRRLPGGQQRR